MKNRYFPLANECVGMYHLQAYTFVNVLLISLSLLVEYLKLVFCGYGIARVYEVLDQLMLLNIV